MKCLRYIVLLVSVLLVAACEQLSLPDTTFFLTTQRIVETTESSAVIEIEFYPTAATIQTVTACYTGGLKKEMTHVKGLVYRVELKNLQSDTEYHVYYEVSNVFSTVVVNANCSFITVESGEKPNNPNTPTVTPEYVDLGLPSGVKWATFNVGATKPEEYGDYFAWGETEPKELYDWSTYSEAEEDVATTKWGGEWRIPTQAEQDELRTECSWTWMTENDVNGYKVVGPNGNSIFLPAAGYCSGSSLYNVGHKGFYWASSLYTGNTSYAYYLSFTYNDVSRYSNDRCYGQSIRPVYDARGEETINEPYFSVSETQKVTFSPGNLQYHPANNEWRFAPSQLDYIGDANSNCSSTYNGWLDLFGWSTSAANFGTSTDKNDYSGSFVSFVDWGTNTIGNDAPNTWRTLSKDEWEYLLNTRTNANYLKGVAQVNGVNGLIFLPDNWICPAGVTFKSGFHSEWSVEAYGQYQTFTADQWSKLEATGAVFLPAAGCRIGSSVYSVQVYGEYWSATEGYANNASYLSFSCNDAYMRYEYRYSGPSVRLVKDL